MIAQVTTFFVRCVPDLLIAAAAAAVFVLLGVIIFFSIVCEHWFTVWRQERALSRLRPAPRRQMPYAAVRSILSH